MIRNTASTKYRTAFNALTASGMATDKAHETLALLGYSKPSPTQAELAEQVPLATGVEYLARYLALAVSGHATDDGKRIPTNALFIWRRHWPEAEKGAYYGIHTVKALQAAGLPVDPDKPHGWTIAPTPSDATLAETWAKMSAESKVVVIRELGKHGQTLPMRENAL
jgi:hypothetical protein